MGPKDGADGKAIRGWDRDGEYERPGIGGNAPLSTREYHRISLKKATACQIFAIMSLEDDLANTIEMWVVT